MQPSNTSLKLRFAALLWLAILLPLIANSADFFFHRPFYEWWDSAANALSVDRAKHFSQLYGAYSRWGFCHPGPALFYLQAFGEWLFYDLLRVSPAPFNAQTLFHLCLMTGLLVVILRIFTHWLPRRAWQLFLPVAVALSALHFTALGRLPTYDVVLGPTALAGLWPVHVVVLPFACMLVAGASVAAGRGRDLPLLFLCAGFLLHLHVSEPLMVVPLVTLSWLGLVVSSPSPASDGQANTRLRRWIGKLAAAWRNHRLAHLLALAIMAVTALPVVIDVCKGADSNLSRILDHMRHYRGEHKSLARSALYFLQYGAYAPFRPYSLEQVIDAMEFGRYDFASAIAYLRSHALAYILWLGGVALVLRVAIRRPAKVDAPVVGEGEPESQRFFVCLCGLLAVVIGLTLYWGTIQDGRMYYYNAWFNFAIYGVIGLGAAAAAALMIVQARSVSATSLRWPPLAAWGAAVAVCASLANPLEVRDSEPEMNAAMHAGIARAMAAYAPPEKRSTVKLLRFGAWYWDGVIAAALQLQREGHRIVVTDQWGVVFGRNTTWSVYEPKQPRPPTERWYFDVEPVSDPSIAAVPFPILHDVYKRFEKLTVSADLPVLDPAGAAGPSSILFRKGGNSLGFMAGGFAGEELWGRWTETNTSLLSFRPAPCGGEDVQLTIDAEPFLMPERGLSHQRVQVLFNGQPLGESQAFTGKDGPLVARIPAQIWNAAATALKPGATLELRLPDATSPHKLNSDNQDKRVLALHISNVSVAPSAEARDRQVMFSPSIFVSNPREVAGSVAHAR